MRIHGIAATGVVMVMVMVLGCSGLVGYGEEVTSIDVQSGQPFQATYTPRKNTPHQVWFVVDLKGGGWSVDGSIDVDGGVQAAFPIGMDKHGGISFRLMWKETHRGASGTAWVGELPAHKVGVPVTVSGTLQITGEPGSTVKLVVTE